MAITYGSDEKTTVRFNAVWPAPVRPVGSQRLDEVRPNSIVRPPEFARDAEVRDMVHKALERIQDRVAKDTCDCVGCPHGEFRILKDVSIVTMERQYRVSAGCAKSSCVMPRTADPLPSFPFMAMPGMAPTKPEYATGTAAAATVPSSFLSAIDATADIGRMASAIKARKEEEVRTAKWPPKTSQDLPQTAADAW